MRRIYINSSLPIILSVVLASCASTPPQNMLEKVAKDWSMTIRAGQVMPVYPLEEDIRPGDVYIVSTSLDAEVKTWKEKGFLPLVNRYDRILISAEQYAPFYKDGYYNGTDAPSFTRLPKAAFPSYSFSTDKRGALGLAIPLESVPVALSLAGAQAATGSVVLQNAATQGLPDKVMDSLVQHWAGVNQTSLQGMANTTNNLLLVRVITKVFTVQGANVSLTFQSTKGAGINVGSSVDAPNVGGASAADYDQLITDLEKQITLRHATVKSPDDANSPTTSNDPELASLQKDLDSLKWLKAKALIKSQKLEIERAASEDKYGGYVLPGAKISVASRSERGITMNETFQKPLVVGYWALEYVLNNGKLTPLNGVLKQTLDDPSRLKQVNSFIARVKSQEVYNPRVESGNPNDNPLKDRK
jgi:hypothetical protein